MAKIKKPAIKPKAKAKTKTKSDKASKSDKPKDWRSKPRPKTTRMSDKERRNIYDDVKAEEPNKSTNKEAIVKAPGRPTVRSKAMEAEIFSRIAAGESVKSICSSDHMPNMTTFFRWKLEDQEFEKNYIEAKQSCAEVFADDMIDIADDGRNDWMEKFDKDGQSIGWFLNGEHVQRSRLRIETRKWLAAKLLPKRFGERVAHDHGTQPGDPLSNLIVSLTNTAALGGIKPTPDNSSHDD